VLRRVNDNLLMTVRVWIVRPDNRIDIVDHLDLPVKTAADRQERLYVSEPVRTKKAVFRATVMTDNRGLRKVVRALFSSGSNDDNSIMNVILPDLGVFHKFFTVCSYRRR
jgi:hypothetical protein